MLIKKLDKSFIVSFLNEAKANVRIYSPWISKFGTNLLSDIFISNKNINIDLYFRFNIEDIALGFVDLSGLNHLKRDGCNLRFFDSDDLHAKVYIVDNTKAVFGSCNFTEKAFSSNFEIASVIDFNNDLEGIISSWIFKPVNQIQINSMLHDIKQVPKDKLLSLADLSTSIDRNTKYALYKTGLR